ncbi:MAG: signal peptidase II [Candidatus Endomicrobiellum trichonymphae]|uniref:signal peptidase II n=1 Tax=Endomicrobium trichonymphae TaxID=1408204 RepID=UPI0027D3702A|nr:MAG: signal peptidase II [Candidatus Endomicrobium trichonymphae]
MKAPFLIGIIMFILDQLTKILVDRFIIYASSVNVISFLDFFNIVNVYNTGAAFGIFRGRNSFFALIMFLFLTALSGWLYKNWNKLHKIQIYAFCLIISGGLGNLTDRLLRGAVVDFLDFGINSLRWPAFNVADSCIFIALVLILADILVFGRRKV